MKQETQPDEAGAGANANESGNGILSGMFNFFGGAAANKDQAEAEVID